MLCNINSCGHEALPNYRYCDTHLCRGLTNSGARCKVANCGIQHKSYLPDTVEEPKKLTLSCLKCNKKFEAEVGAASYALAKKFTENRGICTKCLNTPPIDRFVGEHNFLSNFFAAEVYGYPTVENFYQAMKTTNKEERQQFKALTPGQSKRAGRNLTLREDWEDIKTDVMETALRMKFTSGSDLAGLLVATGTVDLIEGNNWHDNEWGNCTCSNCTSIAGKNMLGKLLMKIRYELAHLEYN